MAKIIVPLPLPAPPTKEFMIAQQISNLIRQAAQSQKNAYDQIRAMVFQNNQKMTPEQVFAAFEQFNSLEMTAQDLSSLASVTKAVLNKFQPGLVVDNVQEATIS